MSHLSIRFHMNNAAFEDRMLGISSAQCSIIRGLATEQARDFTTCDVRDTNGNKIGSALVVEDDAKMCPECGWVMQRVARPHGPVHAYHCHACNQEWRKA